MATIKINTIKCVKLQDSISEDEIKIYIGGVEVAGPFGVHKGQEVRVNTSRPFSGATTVQLREMDGSNYDNLGLRSVSDRPVTAVSMDFDAAKHAFYTMNYTVTA